MLNTHPGFRDVQRKGKKKVIEIAAVYPRVPKVPNNVFKKENCDKIVSKELNNLVQKDNQRYKNKQFWGKQNKPYHKKILRGIRILIMKL